MAAISPEQERGKSLRQCLAVRGYRPHFVTVVLCSTIVVCVSLALPALGIWRAASPPVPQMTGITQERKGNHRRYGQRSVRESAGQSGGPHSDRLS
jgi:hypothetical protein